MVRQSEATLIVHSFNPNNFLIAFKEAIGQVAPIAFRYRRLEHNALFLLLLLPRRWSHRMNAVAGESCVEAVVHAARVGDGKRLHELIAKNAPINDTWHGETALFAAAKAGHYDCVVRLLNAGADAEIAISAGATPLMAAAYGGHVDVVEALVSGGADVFQTAPHGSSAFDFALDGNQVAVLQLITRYLMTRENNAGPIQHESVLLLLNAILDDDLNSLKRLLDAGLDPNLQNPTGYAPLVLASRLDRRDAVRELIGVNANPNVTDDSTGDLSPLIQAARGGHVEVTRSLLEAGADVNYVSAKGNSALMVAAGYGHFRIVLALLEAGARVELLNRIGYSALDWAIQIGSTEIAEALIMAWPARPEDVSTSTLGGAGSALLLRAAAVTGQRQVVDDLVRFVDLNDTKISGYTPLSLAARFGRVAITKVLLDHGADPLITGSTGYQAPPLVDAARDGHAIVGEMLLQAGASVTQGDANGDTALNWATFYGHERYARILLAAGANPYQESRDGYTAVRTAMQKCFGELESLYRSWAEPGQQ